MSNSCTFDGDDLSGASYGFTIEENSFTKMMPQPRVARNGLTAKDGEASQGATFGARQGAARGVIVAANRTALLTQRDNIISSLSKGQEGSKVLTFDAVPGKQWDARVIGVAFGEETAVTLDVSITFYAAQPWAIASSTTSTTDTPVTAGGTDI